MNKYNEKTTISEFPFASRKAAREGMVLLKNNNETLPIKKGETISLFGRCQIDYYKSGTGSGGAVNVLYEVNALEGVRNNEGINVNESLVSLYEIFISENPFDNGGGGWAQEPWFQQEMPLTNEICSQASKQSDKAVVFIGRTAGEDKDNIATKGSYYLTDDEIDMLDKVTDSFNKVAVVLNVGNIIDMNWLEKYNDKIDSVLYSWAGGMEGGNALADILSGTETPSGKLAGTIAYKLKDHPTHKNFGNDKTNLYEEDIYVGYRYFETFHKEAVQFPFGFGLSYTTFEIAFVTNEVTSTYIDLTFEVTNTGSYKGKEIVQIYVEKPQGKLGKPVRELIGFAKTELLHPQQQETLSIRIPKNRLSSYDDNGITGYKSAYVLEEGTYIIHAGNSIRDTKVCLRYDVEQTIVIEQLTEALAPIQELRRMKPGRMLPSGNYEITYEDVLKRTINLQERIIENLPKNIAYTGNKEIMLNDVKEGKHSIESFIAQLTPNQLMLLVRGEGMSHPLVTPGTAAAFGGLYEELHNYGIPATCAADGPSGLRMDSGHKATQLPIGSLLACSWNLLLMEELYVLEGKELKLNKVDTLLGPGLNIHRHPLNGRNFEYFSEDPFLTGCFSKAAAIGMEKGGSTTTLKHFIANDQEKERNHIDAVASERCLREIHLKGFEIAVKEGNARSIMTAYNPINGIQAASNYDMNTTVLRKEWGFKGIVMTDWWAIMNHNVEGGISKKENTSYMVRSQNDIYMVVSNYGGKKNAMNDDLEEALNNGTLLLSELQRSAINICEFIMQAPAMDRKIEKAKVLSVLPNQAFSKESINISNPVPFNTKTNKSISLDIKELGIYSIAVDIRYDQSALAQSACNITMNSTYIYNIQLNGNGNKWTKEYIVNVSLEPGQYDFELDFTKPGLEIGTIEFVKL